MNLLKRMKGNCLENYMNFSTVTCRVYIYFTGYVEKYLIREYYKETNKDE